MAASTRQGELQAGCHLFEATGAIHRPSGARSPKAGCGIGPPVTGKTLLAKRFSGGGRGALFSMAARSSSNRSWVWAPPRGVRDLFKARQGKPLHHSLMRSMRLAVRPRRRIAAANDEREQTLNQAAHGETGLRRTPG